MAELWYDILMEKKRTTNLGNENVLTSQLAKRIKALQTELQVDDKTMAKMLAKMPEIFQQEIAQQHDNERSL